VIAVIRRYRQTCHVSFMIGMVGFRWYENTFPFNSAVRIFIVERY